MASLCLINPRYESLIRRNGLDQFDRVMHWHNGRRMVSHPSRDVTQIDIENGGEPVRLYAKREWQTYAKDRLVGWLARRGWGTKARHEWRVLQAMTDAGVGCAEPVVLVERGRGRPQGYLIVKAIPGAVEVTDYLAERRPTMSVHARREFAAHLGREVARLHEAGIDHPDLYSKHVLLSEYGVPLPRVCFIDMQRSSAGRPVPVSRRLRDLAALHATVSETLASATDRLTFLDSYLKHVTVPISRPRASDAIGRRAGQLLRRRKIRDMRSNVGHATGKFVQLDDQATLFAASNWIESLRQADLDNFDRIMATDCVAVPQRRSERDTVLLELPSADGPVRVHLQRFRGRYPLAWLRQRVFGRRVQLPGWQAAAQIGRSNRSGSPAPELIAFGQRFGRWCRGDSFVLTREMPGAGCLPNSKLLP